MQSQVVEFVAVKVAKTRGPLGLFCVPAVSQMVVVAVIVALLQGFWGHRVVQSQVVEFVAV